MTKATDDKTSTAGSATSLDLAELERLLHTAVFAAQESVRIQRREAGKDLQIETKSSDVDLVTRVDKLCEERIREIIGTAYPTHSILGEEEGSAVGSDARYRWIVDPIDGTVNFAHELPFHSASVALEVDGTVVVGAVMNASTGDLFTAVLGQGAKVNGLPATVTGVSALKQSLVVTGFSYDVEKRYENLELFGRVLPEVQGVRRLGSAALDICNVACGRTEAFWELALNAWDVAAAVLILREAGGTVTDGKGLPYEFGEPLLVATNGHIHAKLLGLLGTADQRA